MKYLAILGGGHGTDTAGKRSPKLPDGSVMKENYFNDVVVKYAKELLEYIGVDVYDVAPEGNDVPLKTRTDRANAKFDEYTKKYGKDGFKCVYISVHANAYLGKFGNWGGIDTFYYENTRMGSDDFAKVVQKHLIKGSPLKDRGTKPANFHVLRQSKMIAVLAEMGFMDSKHDIDFLLSDSYRKECAKEVSQAICEWFGIEYKEKVESNKLYKVQIGAFGIKENAEKLEQKAKDAGFNTYIEVEER